MRTGIATFTLDEGRCPKWLFNRMVKLGREMVRVIVAEEGADEFIRRISNPVWFQSIGTVLAFDWNASGLTTILTAALKEAIKGEEKDLGIFICGGKGKTSLKTPDEIRNWGERLDFPADSVSSLIYSSKMSAKVDSSLIHDGFQIYHHSFFFSNPPTGRGSWAVVQQGMNTGNATARRYHWSSEVAKDLVREPHSGIISDKKSNPLNLVAHGSEDTRNLSTELVNSGYNTAMKDIKILRKHSSHLHKMVSLTPTSILSLNKGEVGREFTLLKLENKEFKFHPVVLEDFSKSKYLEKILWKVCEQKPENYEKLLAISGVGPKTMRALALVGEVIYGAKPSYEDPARFSFAHGGKDATPYPVDRLTYDKTIETMRRYISKMDISISEKKKLIANS